MKITFLTTLFAILLTLPAFGFSLGDLLNLQKKPPSPENRMNLSLSLTLHLTLLRPLL